MGTLKSEFHIAGYAVLLVNNTFVTHEGKQVFGLALAEQVAQEAQERGQVGARIVAFQLYPTVLVMPRVTTQSRRS